MSKIISIPFQKEFHSALICGQKICTARFKKYGEPGDTFYINKLGFLVTHVYKTELGDVGRCWRQEGCLSSDHGKIVPPGSCVSGVPVGQVNDMAEHFVEVFTSNGRAKADWDATWKTFVRNELKREEERKERLAKTGFKKQVGLEGVDWHDE